MKFREVNRRKEVENINSKKEDGYKNIKPESDITIEEAREYWDSLFSNMFANK